MNLHYKNSITAILSMAVIFCGLMLTNCVTPRHIDEIKAQLDRIEADNKSTQELVGKMDSLVTMGAMADNRLRSDLSTSMSEIQDQISALLENYNDLLMKIDQLSQKPKVKHIIKSSPGAESSKTETTPPEYIQSDCGDNYDNAFILTRRGEFEQAIEGFKAFLVNCSKHESVENALYWIGHCYYSLDKFPDAIENLEKLINDFKASPNLGRALYKLARSKQEMGKNDEAKTLYQKLIDNYPETLEAQQAKERLKDI